MNTTELYQKFSQDQKEVTNAISRLDQRHADAVAQYNSSVSELSNALKSWSWGTLAEDDLKAAYAKADTLKPMTNPEPFRLAKESFESEIKRLNEAYQNQRRQIVAQEQEDEYKKLFNAAVAAGKPLSDVEKCKLKSTATNGSQSDLNKLFAALNDYNFKFKNHPSPPTFQEYSKIDYYDVENITQPKAA